MDETPGRSEPNALTLLAEDEVRRALAGRTLVFRLLAPPYPALGVGTLRALRVVERGEAAEVVAGYERYERLEAQARREARR
ncbi:MAG: hypothetical protein WAJ85_08470 [Candidatus Baltobacteraceae bacterium]|jgi:hypothetical protein